MLKIFDTSVQQQTQILGITEYNVRTLFVDH